MINPPSEAIEQQRLIKWLRLKKIVHFSLNNENQSSFTNRMIAIRVEAKAKSMGKIKGASDVVVMLPNKILFIELKRAPKTLKSGKQSVSHTKVSEEQKSFLNAVNEFEYAKGFICYGASEAIEKISEFL